MKLLTIAAICTAVVFSNEAALAQTRNDEEGLALNRCYDPFPAGGGYTATDSQLMGDTITVPCNNVTEIEIGFVARAAGAHKFGFDIWPTRCLGAPPAPPLTVVIPPGGVFPSSWRVTITPSVPHAAIQHFSVSGSSLLYPAYTVNAGGIPKGIDGYSIDIAPKDGTLQPNFPGCGGFEWYSSGDQSNQLVALITTPGPLAVLHGPFVKEGYTVVKVERDSAPVRLVSGATEIKPN